MSTAEVQDSEPDGGLLLSSCSYKSHSAHYHSPQSVAIELIKPRAYM